MSFVEVNLSFCCFLIFIVMCRFNEELNMIILYLNIGGENSSYVFGFYYVNYINSFIIYN